MKRAGDHNRVERDVTAVALAVCSWMLAAALLLVVLYRRSLSALWHEPVLRAPVLIIESDDWGAGPREQADLLERIGTILASHRDRMGHRPVMTLGIVLGVADGARMLAGGLDAYHRRSLGEPDFAAIVAAAKRGEKAGVFALQLHGDEHYWPPALLAAARAYPEVVAWLAIPGIARTEALPARLQSRWVDATELPSKPLRADEIRNAALAEATAFRGVFESAARVAVPPTFIWNDAVEAAWAEAGIRVVVTPGRRYEARDAEGNPTGPRAPILNCESGTAGITYLVRDAYFEPSRGHTAERGLAALSSKTRVGRPTLLETHRANFLGDPVIANAAIAELDRLLSLALGAFPNLVFLSPENLARMVQERDPELVHSRFGIRLHMWLRRSWKLTRLRKLAIASGAIVPAWLVFVSTWPRLSARHVQTG